MRFPQLNFETFGAIGAIIVSLAALFVAWDQAVVMRRQQHAAVMPIITVDMSINQNETANVIELGITNVGVGPAIVLSATPTMDGEPSTRWHLMANQIFGTDFEEPIQLSASTAASVLGPNESETVLGIRWPRNETGDAKLIEIARGVTGDTFPAIEMDLCYCSVFDRCWTVGGSDLSFPEPAEQCTPSGDFLETFFLDDADGAEGTEQ